MAAYTISYTQSGYNGISTSGTLDDVEFINFSVSSFSANTLIPFIRSTYTLTSTSASLKNVIFSESSFNESGGVFSNTLQGLTISVGLRTDLEYTTTSSNYSAGETTTAVWFSSVDSPMVTYTSPTGNEYLLPTDDYGVATSSITYKKLRFVVATEGGAATRCTVNVISSISSDVRNFSSSSRYETTSSTRDMCIANASMNAATRIYITTYSSISSTYSLTFNLTSVSSEISTKYSGTGWKAIDGTVTFRYTDTSTTSRTSLVIDPNLSQLSRVVGIYQYDVMTSISEVLGTGTLENVITDSTYTTYTRSSWDGINMTGSVADYDCKVTYFVSTDLESATDTFRLASVETSLSTSTQWIRNYQANYSVNQYLSTLNTSSYTQSIFDSVSISRSSMVSSTYSRFSASIYLINTETSTATQDYGNYYRTTTFSTIASYITNTDFSVTTLESQTSSRASSEYIATSSTSSCDITSYTNTDNHGYAYFTTFYGSIAKGTSSASSWINSAILISDVSDYISSLTKYTVGYTDKIFGNVFSSTTIHEESIIESRVWTTSESQVTVSELSIKSSTLSSTDAPYEYFTTEYTSYSNNTYYYTYMGPETIGAIVGQTSYNLNESVTRIASGSWYDYISEQRITSSTLNTVDYGTTYRLSELISSSSWFNIGNVNGTVNYRFSYDVNSMFSYNTLISTLSNYTTVLATTYSVSYNTVTEAVSYSFTATQSNTVKTTGERFIDKVEIYRTSTVGVYGRNTVAVFSGSTLDTISSRVTTESAISTSQDVSTVDRTFITSSADFITNTELVTQDTLSSVSNRFISSSSFMISSTYEQQDETLMFKSSWNKYSYYYNTSYYSTVDTIQLTISASTYESLYVPASFTTTSGYTSRSSTTGSYSSSTLVTSVSSYTTTWMPVYTTVDGVYVTTE